MHYTLPNFFVVWLQCVITSGKNSGKVLVYLPRYYLPLGRILMLQNTHDKFYTYTGLETLCVRILVLVYCMSSIYLFFVTCRYTPFIRKGVHTGITRAGDHPVTVVLLYFGYKILSLWKGNIHRDTL
jgi:hypothetical protein